MCEDAGVTLIYLLPYSPDLNSIKEFFAELKGNIRRNWNYNEKTPREDSMPSLNSVSMWGVQNRRAPTAIVVMWA
jgi:transposase